VIAATALALATTLAAGADGSGFDQALSITREPEPETFVRKTGPGFKLGLTRFVLPDQADSENEVLLGSVETYFYSGYLRVGMGVQGGVGRPRNDILATGGLTAAVQWPANVTPFLEFGFGGGAYYRKMLAGQLFWVHAFKVDAGLEIYLLGDFYLSAAVGWTRPVIHRASAGRDLYYDVLAMKLGLGF